MYIITSHPEETVNFYYHNYCHGDNGIGELTNEQCLPKLDGLGFISVQFFCFIYNLLEFMVFI